MQEAKVIYKFDKTHVLTLVYKKIVESIGKEHQKELNSGQMSVDMDVDNKTIIVVCKGEELCKGFVEGIQSATGAKDRVLLRVFGGLRAELYIDGKKERLI